MLLTWGLSEEHGPPAKVKREHLLLKDALRHTAAVLPPRLLLARALTRKHHGARAHAHVHKQSKRDLNLDQWIRSLFVISVMPDGYTLHSEGRSEVKIQHANPTLFKTAGGSGRRWIKVRLDWIDSFVTIPPLLPP